MNRSSGLFKATGIIAIVEGVIVLLSVFWAIFPIALGILMIVAGYKYIKYADMYLEEFKDNKSVATGWGIFLVITCTVAGILGLIGVNQLESDNRGYEENSANEQNYKNEAIEESKLEKIERLKSLKERGVLNEQEFEELKEKIVNES